MHMAGLCDNSAARAATLMRCCPAPPRIQLLSSLASYTRAGSLMPTLLFPEF
jgi:hypothetical protein